MYDNVPNGGLRMPYAVRTVQKSEPEGTAEISAVIFQEELNGGSPRRRIVSFASNHWRQTTAVKLGRQTVTSFNDAELNQHMLEGTAQPSWLSRMAGYR